MIEPYASGRRWTLYAGDCLDVLAAGLLPVDGALISDVPYGMSANTDSRRFTGGKSGRIRRRESQGRNWQPIAGDDRPFDPALWLDFPHVCLFGANHFAARLPVGTTLVWVKKPAHLWGSFLSDAEIAWVKGGHGVYVREVHWNPPAAAIDAGGDVCHPKGIHPTQKPTAVMEWCFERAKVPPDGLVIDPYCGSGSTGVAALRSGRTFVGVEVNPEYLAIAARRLAQAEHDGRPQSLFPLT